MPRHAQRAENRLNKLERTKQIMLKFLKRKKQILGMNIMYMFGFLKRNQTYFAQKTYFPGTNIMYTFARQIYISTGYYVYVCKADL